MSENEALSRGLAVVTEATEADKAGDTARAVQLYRRALAAFDAALAAERNPKNAALLRAKMREYGARLDVLVDEPVDASAGVSHAPAIDWSALQAQQQAGGATQRRSGELERATALIERATRADEARQFADALPLYEAGLAHLLNVYQATGHAALKAALKDRLELYLARAEKLKKWLQARRTDVSADAAPLVSAAIAAVERAQALDSGGDARGAVQHYEQAKEHFRAALKAESNANARAMISSKLVDVGTRVERIRNPVEQSSSISFGLASADQKYVDPTKKKGFFRR